jgi:spore protease
MAQTGMETSQIVKGIVNTSKPGVVVVVDALAAKSVKHLNKTFQISDRGINPGSGVGNHRDGITSKTVGVPVVALGLPTVIEMNSMFVTPKDDEGGVDNGTGNFQRPHGRKPEASI